MFAVPTTVRLFESVVALATVRTPPTLSVFAIPTPPDTISDPVVVAVESVVFVSDTEPDKTVDGEDISVEVPFKVVVPLTFKFEPIYKFLATAAPPLIMIEPEEVFVASVVLCIVTVEVS